MFDAVKLAMKMKQQLCFLVAGAVFSSVLTTVASENLIVNGSFEQGNFIGDVHTSYNSIGPGGTAVTGWMTTEGFDWHQAVEFGPAYDGYRMIDLTAGSADGNIAQTFSTTPGAAYTLTFAVAAPGTFFGSPVLDVSVGNVLDHFTIPRSVQFPLTWTVDTVEFQATSASTTLEFSGHSFGDYWGPVIDDVSVTSSVPDAGLTAGMLGLAVAGLGWVRRKI
jgi:choice-of-anchor C domain-containing protein